MYSAKKTRQFTGGFFMKEIERLKSALSECDAVLIGAGSGLSTAAGLTYSGERFEKYFFDFAEAFGIRDMYLGGFYPFPDEETLWAWWARHIYFNRYINPPKKVYEALLSVGANTPGIIKYPFWQMTARNPNATYACLNFGEAVAPQEIAGHSICINGDIGEVLGELV